MIDDMVIVLGISINSISDERKRDTALVEPCFT